MSQGSRWMTIGGRSVKVTWARDGKVLWLNWPDGSLRVEASRHRAEAADSDDAVIAPMTGKAVRVSVSVDEHVEEGALLVVLEAMKMEYRLSAPYAGRVVSVHCEEGELVDLGATLVTLERT